MFGKKESNTDEFPPFMEREGRVLAQLNQEGHQWLGQRFAWYNKVRTAKKGGLRIFKDPSLEEQMEATRGALNMVTNIMNTNLMMAFNAMVDQVKSVKAEPEDWPAKIEGDRTDAPTLTHEQDAGIISWVPLKFLNIAKPIRDKGKGVDYYVDGLIKKIYFKIIGFYADPRNWDPEKLGFFFNDLDPDASLQEVQGRLAPLKADADMFALTLFPFRFGKATLRPEAGQKNTIDENFEISDEELRRDLYFQSLMWLGLDKFIFRYFLTLLSATDNPRAIRQLSHIFHPIIAKIIELNLRFHSSSATEREKIRIRPAFLEFYKAREALPAVETVEVKGRSVRKINYTHRMLESNSFSRGHNYHERHRQLWKDYLSKYVVKEGDVEKGGALLMDILNMMVWDTMCAMEGKVKAAGELRAFADEQEKLGKVQLAKNKKKVDEAKRAKRRSLSKFKVQKQNNMVEIVSREMEELETAGTEQLEKMEAMIQTRREKVIARVDKMEMAALQDREENLGKNAAALYQVLLEVDEDKSFRGGLVTFLMHQIQEDKDEISHNLYRNLFNVFGDLFPTEKMMLRSAIAQKITLEENDLMVSEEEMQAYQQQIVSRKTELNTEVPGIMEQKLSQGPVRAKIDQLLDMNLTPASLRLLFNLNFSGPNKAAAKIPGEAVKKLLMINQLVNPLPEHDISLPNVEENAPAMKRVNFNRLQKLMV